MWLDISRGYVAGSQPGSWELEGHRGRITGFLETAALGGNLGFCLPAWVTLGKSIILSELSPICKLGTTDQPPVFL
jgi:hypothetical protein